MLLSLFCQLFHILHALSSLRVCEEEEHADAMVRHAIVDLGVAGYLRHHVSTLWLLRLLLFSLGQLVANSDG
jgi:hypothetical protein